MISRNPYSIMRPEDLRKKLASVGGVLPNYSQDESVGSAAILGGDVGGETAAKAVSAPASSDLASTGILAGAGALGGVMKSRAEAANRKQDLEFAAENQKYENLAKAAHTLNEGERQAMIRFMANLRGVGR